MAKKVLMLLNSPYPADMRVRKESDALIKAGFEVHLLCLCKKNQQEIEVVDGIHITRIHAGKNNYQLAFWDVILSIGFVHPRFLRHARKLISATDFTAIHVHDLPLAGTALELKKEKNIKVVVDFHENYPEALRTWFQWKKNPIVRLKNYFFMNPDRWTRFEKIASEGADAIIAVVDEMKGRLIAAYGVDASKITVVTNTEDRSFIQQPLDPTVYQQFAGKFIITYSGGIGPHRGVDTAIEGMKYLKDQDAIQLVIIGFGSPSVMKSLQVLVTNHQLQNVHFLGYQPFPKFYSFMKFASVNVIPHQSNGHTDNTVPHKLFQGMMAGQPLLVSSSTPLKRLVEKYKSGVVFTAGDAKDFAEKATYLFQHPEQRESMGNRGMEVTLNGPVNWEEDQKNLTQLYNQL